MSPKSLTRQAPQKRSFCASKKPPQNDQNKRLLTRIKDGWQKFEDHLNAKEDDYRRNLEKLLDSEPGLPKQREEKFRRIIAHLKEAKDKTKKNDNEQANKEPAKNEGRDSKDGGEQAKKEGRDSKDGGEQAKKEGRDSKDGGEQAKKEGRDEQAKKEGRDSKDGGEQAKKEGRDSKDDIEKIKKDFESALGEIVRDMKTFNMRFLAPVLFVTTAIVYYLSRYRPNVADEEISYNRFVSEYLQRDLVEKVAVPNIAGNGVNFVKIFVRDRDAKLDKTGMDDEGHENDSAGEKGRKVLKLKVANLRTFEKLIEEEQRRLGKKTVDFIAVEYYVPQEYLRSNCLGVVAQVFVFLTFWALLKDYKLQRGESVFKKGGIFKSNGKDFGSTTKVQTRLKDVAGLKNAKSEVEELAQFLKDSSRFVRLGAKIPKGALLVGPPGTGKTLIAKAIAGESDCNFLSASGSEFLEMFVGTGAARVRRLFENARHKQPAIIFIDEIDAIGARRNKQLGDDERERTLNQLLVEMDGFRENENVIVLAGTNRVDILDKALLRAGRFDRRITIDLPDILERKEIFEVHLAPIKIPASKRELAERLAALTTGFSGADIANVCNEGAILAARRKGDYVTFDDFEKAFDRVIAGLEKTKGLLTPREQQIVAYHEAGHAVAGWFKDQADPLLKVTIKPRVEGVMGFSQYLPKELSIYTREQLLSAMGVALGGRIAESMFFGQLSSGACDDIEKVTKIAYKAVREFGMSEALGNLSFPRDEEMQLSVYSDEVAALIDEEARALVGAVYEATEKLLLEKKADIVKLAEALLERETLLHDDIVELLGKKAFVSFDYRKYLENTKNAGNDSARNDAAGNDGKNSKDDYKAAGSEGMAPKEPEGKVASGDGAKKV